METLYLPKDLRPELRKVWGIPIFGTEKEVAQEYARIVKKEGFGKVITVGDYCSATLPSDVKIFDGKVKRQKTTFNIPHELTCVNPAGTIRAEAWPTIKQAIKELKNIFVKGEEDLLVIPTVLLSKKGDAVIYGFPNKGVCLIKISTESQKAFKGLLAQFERD